MSRSEIGLMVFSTFLMVAITISYFIKPRLSEDDSYALDREFTRSIPSVVAIEDGNYEAWQAPEFPSELSNVDQEDEDLIQHIREQWILPPSDATRKLDHPEKYDHSEFGESFVVDKLLAGKERGFYVDCWVGNGEDKSNTLFLEKDRRWDGLLVEPNPENFAKLVGKRRHAYLLNACVSPATTPVVLNLTYGSDSDTLSTQVQCFPLYSILAALELAVVDYLSLKARGMEDEIIRTLPLKDLTVRVVSAQTLYDKDKRSSEENHGVIKRYLISKHYQWVDAGERITKNEVIMIHKDSYRIK